LTGASLPPARSTVLPGTFSFEPLARGKVKAATGRKLGFRSPLTNRSLQWRARDANGLWFSPWSLLPLFFRLYRLDSQPGSLWLDESLTALNALEIIDGKPAPLWGMTPLDRWRPDGVKTSNLYLYFVLGVFKVFGTGYFGLKAISYCRRSRALSPAIFCSRLWPAAALLF
jgi:hypothetical protein